MRGRAARGPTGDDLDTQRSEFEMTNQEAPLAVDPAPALDGLSREHLPDVDAGVDVERGESGHDSQASSAWQIAVAVSLALLIAISSFAAGILAERQWLAEDIPESGGPTIGEIEALLAAESYYWPDDPSAQDAVRAELEQG